MNNRQLQKTKKKTKILVIDDEQGIRDLLSYGLKSCGYIVATACNGEEGIKEIEKQRYDIVISDIKMPKVGGIEALEMIKNIDPSIEVIMTTGFGTIDLAVESMKKGAYDFITKPYNLEELYSRIGKAVEKQNLSSELTSLKELNQLKSEFLANTSHELRTPMNAIIGYTSLLLDKIYGNLTEKQDRVIKRINTNAANLLQVINNLLDMSKLYAGKLQFYFETFSLNKLINGTIDMMEAIANEKKVSIAFKADKEIEMHSDKARMKQILTNLLGNAVKFTNGGSIIINLNSLGDDSNGDNEKIRITIKDTGIGIKAEYINSIFEEFRQADASTTREYGGTGLGLSIVKKLVDMLGGEINVQSIHGKGSVFSVILPCNSKINHSINDLPSSYRNIAENDNNVLLVVDNKQESHDYIKGQLQDSDYVILDALTKDEAITFARQFNPFAIVANALQNDGWLVIQALKNDNNMSSIPVILMAASKGRALKFSFIINDFILKPFNKNTLTERFGRIKLENGKTVLLVEDDKNLNNAIQGILKSEGFSVNPVFNVKDAVRSIKADKPDIILLDLTMHKASGFDIIKTIQSNTEFLEVKIIMMIPEKLSKKELGLLNKCEMLIKKSGSTQIKEAFLEVNKKISITAQAVG